MPTATQDTSPSSFRSTTEISRIEGLLAARNRAMYNRDADALLACGTDDSVVFSLAPPLRATNDGGAFLREWFLRWATPIGYDVTDLEIHLDGGVAFTASIDRMHGQQHGQPPFELWMRVTLGLVRRDGRWLIAHQHESVPFAMDGSFRALVDLEP